MVSCTLDNKIGNALSKTEEETLDLEFYFSEFGEYAILLPVHLMEYDYPPVKTKWGIITTYEDYNTFDGVLYSVSYILFHEPITIPAKDYLDSYVENDIKASFGNAEIISKKEIIIENHHGLELTLHDKSETDEMIVTTLRTFLNDNIQYMLMISGPANKIKKVPVKEILDSFHFYNTVAYYKDYKP